MDYSEYIDEKKKEIRSRLEQYMTLEGITIHGINFSCPNKTAHKHGDTVHLSAAIKERGTSGVYWNCFGCGAGSDTIAFAHYHEGLPIRGGEFLTETLPTLCKKLDIKYDPESVLTPEQKEKALLFRANEMISSAAKDNLVSILQDEGRSNSDVEKFMTDRNLTIEDVNRFDLGLLDMPRAVKVMTDNNIPYGIQREICVDRESQAGRDIFNEYSIIFTLRDHRGLACGFAARNLKYNAGNDRPKFVNIHNNRIFVKKNHLYGLHAAKESAASENQIYIVEGYMDRISLAKAGIENVAAICGVAFSEDHMALVHKVNISGILFALDGDKAGKKAAAKLEGIFSKYKMVTPFVMELPHNEDPDSVVRTRGIAGLQSLPTYTMVEYKIKDMFEKASTNEMTNIEEKIEEFFTWLIGYEVNHIKRLKSIDLLAEYTGIANKDLRKQLEYQDKVMSDEVVKNVDSIWYDMLRDGKTAILRERIDMLDDVRVKLTEMLPDEERDVATNQIESVDEIYKEFKSSEITSIKFGWNETFDKNVMIPKAASVVMVGAYPNVGKSILMRNMAIGALQNNPDMGVIYFSMDDPKKQTIPAMVANLNHVKVNDIRYQKMIHPDAKDKTLTAIDGGFAKLKSMMNSNRLAIYDQSDVMTIGEIETQILLCMDRMSKNKMKPMIIIDSLHSIANPTSVSGIRADLMYTIRAIKRMSNVLDIPIIGVAELRKGGNAGARGLSNKKPSLRDISETVDIEYRVTVGIILHNELQLLRETSTLYWKDTNTGNELLPIVQLIVEKNKEGYFKGDIWLKSNPFYSHMAEVPECDKATIQQQPPAGEVSNYNSAVSTVTPLPTQNPPELPQTGW